MSEPRANSSGSGKGVKAPLYIVDDEAMLLELSSVILEPLGYPIKTFRDPEEALAAFTAAQPRPALIITDYAMHSMNGLALAEACRRLEPAQKVLLLSGTVGEEILHHATCRPDRFLGKPYHAKQLLELVRSMLAA
jgi:two-component system, cell cycle sensor histidine kinase and response regulator CckA